LLSLKTTPENGPSRRECRVPPAVQRATRRGSNVMERLARSFPLTYRTSVSADAMRFRPPLIACDGSATARTAATERAGPNAAMIARGCPTRK
ncbi:MAG: hypothetical protein ABIT38_11285, partial [Gemmatimonadaceae bacterium]